MPRVPFSPLSISGCRTPLRALLLSALAAPALYSPARDSLGSADDCPPVGGQAVLEGVVMRNEDSCALAVRLSDGGILAEHRPWRSLFSKKWTGARFVRGFPIMLETLLNGVDALTRSAELGGDDDEKLSAAMLVTALVSALALGVGMFVVLPHVLAVVAQTMGVSGGMGSFGFHLWDGAFKFGIFFCYIAVISNMRDIRRVFQYHGAEHKVIGAWEEGGEVSARTAARQSRLHPRCGTTFLLFVLALAIVVHAVFVPPLASLWSGGAVFRHGMILGVKILLMIPISSLAYELIRLTSRLGDSPPGKLLRLPGLMLQLFTTREPDKKQLEVAVVALAEAVGEDYADRFQTPAYTVLE